MIIIKMRGENFVAHLDSLGGTPVAHHRTSTLLCILSELRHTGNTHPYRSFPQFHSTNTEVIPPTGHFLPRTSHILHVTIFLPLIQNYTTLSVDTTASSKEIPCLLWNPNVHYRAHKRSPLAIMSLFRIDSNII
jgi:hypothetical protein